MKTFFELRKELDELDEGIIGGIGKAVKKIASPITNRITRSGRAAIAQKKIDKHDQKQDRKNTIATAKSQGIKSFGLTQKSRAANAQKKLDKKAKIQKQKDTIAKARSLK